MYNNFAKVYDKLTFDVEYDKFVDYIIKIFQKYGKNPELVLDLACGTGNITIPMAELGFDMIGIDLSVEMLEVAQNKANDKKLDILFINQDITDFELYGTVDAILCILDSVNYILDIRDLRRFFKLCKNYLNPDGLLIFDINTKYKFSEILGNNIFVSDFDDIFYTWQNDYSKASKKCYFYLTFFEKIAETYNRFDEQHTERVYENDEIIQEIKRSGLTFLNCFDEFTFNSPKQTSLRNFFIAQK